MKATPKGFTLLELMIAMAIFSFMSVVAYAGLANVLISNEVITEQEKKLKALQRSMMFFERDIRQLVSRPSQTGYNQQSPAFSYGLDSEGLLEFTRAGNPNPAGLVRSSLQRVRYDLEDKKLTRMSWALVDHIDAEPINIPLMEGVESFELRLLDNKNEWQTNWSSNDVIPLAVELSLKHDYWGLIVRLIPVR